ncbi:hypothetical protein [Arsenicicoccus bolidensis]|uniref:hypothetical protein n=1 Tax=Arsenicicoccus bolidensis TaxID=229480 RepID=UPI0027DF769D|nr:hypothetical protein [Arsenicicoccus bolidensis]
MREKPSVLHTVLDAEDVRALAEFYRRLLALVYRPGDEPPTDAARRRERAPRRRRRSPAAAAGRGGARGGSAYGS